MTSVPMPAGPAMLVVGHPGHELRVHGWLEKEHPIVMVLTDGSGHAGVSRLGSTAALLERAGATCGAVFGRFSDADLYRTLLDRNTIVFVDLAEELAAAIARHRIMVVAGDDVEGFNPAHDVCRLVVDAAVRLARTASSPAIANLAFVLMESPDPSRQAGGSTSTVILDDAALARKLTEALRYPEMASEVTNARSRWGDEAFRSEEFRHVAEDEVWTPGAEPPFYERHGAKRVDAGLYAEVIRYDQHIRPVADALSSRVLRQAS